MGRVWVTSRNDPARIRPFDPKRRTQRPGIAPGDVTSWESAKSWFNFGTLAIDRDGTLTAGIVNTSGSTVFDLRLEP